MAIIAYEYQQLIGNKMTKKELVSLSMPPQVLIDARAIAQSNDRSLSAMISILLREAITNRQQTTNGSASIN